MGGNTEWLHLCRITRRTRLLRIAGGRPQAPTQRVWQPIDCRGGKLLPGCRLQVHGSHLRKCARGAAWILPPLRLCRTRRFTVPRRPGDAENSGSSRADVEGVVEEVEACYFREGMTGQFWPIARRGLASLGVMSAVFGPVSPTRIVGLPQSWYLAVHRCCSYSWQQLKKGAPSGAPVSWRNNT